MNGFGDLDPDFGDESKLIEATSPVSRIQSSQRTIGVYGFIELAAFPKAYRESRTCCTSRQLEQVQLRWVQGGVTAS